MTKLSEAVIAIAIAVPPTISIDTMGLSKVEVWLFIVSVMLSRVMDAPYKFCAALVTRLSTAAGATSECVLSSRKYKV